jgi:tetratricopeptide (TPR) repeat protein
MADASNRNGGADFNANEVDVGGDVVGRDKVVQQTTTYNYYGALPSQPRRAELPHQPYFFGREEELAIIADALDPESNGWGVLIDGPGGIGKTALAIRAGHLAPDHLYPTKIFLSAKVRELTPQGEQKLEDFMLPSYMMLLTELARELGDEGIARIDPAERVREVRRLLENSHALIIIDNLETFDEEERKRLFQFLRRLPRSCKALVTSRKRANVAAEVIQLDRLSADATQKLISKLAEGNRHLMRATFEERQTLYEITQGNPLLLEWIAGQLGRPASKCHTIADACKYLDNASKANDPLDYIFGGLLDTFDKHEIAVLAVLAHFNLPVNIKCIAKLARFSAIAVQTVLDDLIDLALVRPSIQTDAYLLSSLVGVLVRSKCPTDVERSTNRLTRRVLAVVRMNGYRKYKRYPALEAEWPVIAAALPLFVQGDNRQLQQLCEGLRRFLDFSGRWDEWLYLCLKAEEKARDMHDLKNAGWRANNLGRLYYVRGQAAEILDCAQRARDYWELSPLTGFREEYTILTLEGWGYTLLKDYPRGIKALKDSLEIRCKLDPVSEPVAIGMNDLARAEQRSGDYSSAEQDYEEALRIARIVKYDEGVAAYTGNLAELALERHDWALAESRAWEALSLSGHISRQVLVATNSYRLAKALTRQGHVEEGLPYIRSAVDIFTKLHSRYLADAQAILKECGG